jgi:hypothetical protein
MSAVPRAYVVAPNGPPPLSSSVLCSVSCEYPSGTNINAERWPQSRRKPNGRSLACALVVCAYARNGVQRAPVTRRTTNVRPPAGTRWPTSPTRLHGALVVRSPSGDKGTHFGHKGYVLSRAATAYRCVYHSRVRPRSSVVRQLCNRSHDRRLLTASLPSRSAPLSDAAPLARLCAFGHCDGLPPAVLFPTGGLTTRLCPRSNHRPPARSARALCKLG